MESNFSTSQKDKVSVFFLYEICINKKETNVNPDV